MDPLSVISGVAGVASTAAALASSLYDLISNIRDAPREMKEVAAGIRELSGVLRELRNILRGDTDEGLFRDGLFQSIHSAMDRIAGFHDEIRELIKSGGGGGGVARIQWAFRKSKADKFLAKIDSLKLTVSLMMSTMSLALEQDKHTNWRQKGGHPDEDERAFLRKQVETLVQATKQSINDAASPKPTQRDIGTQTDKILTSPSLTMPATEGDLTAKLEQHQHQQPSIYEQTQGHSTQITRWGDTPDDTARWLYRLIFGDQTTHDLNLGNMEMVHVPVTTLVSATNSLSRAEVVDRLLRTWSRLDIDEIQELQNLSSDDDDEGGPNAKTPVRTIHRPTKRSPPLGLDKHMEEDDRNEAKPKTQGISSPPWDEISDDEAINDSTGDSEPRDEDTATQAGENTRYIHITDDLPDRPPPPPLRPPEPVDSYLPSTPRPGLSPRQSARQSPRKSRFARDVISTYSRYFSNSSSEDKEPRQSDRKVSFDRSIYFEETAAPQRPPSPPPSRNVVPKKGILKSPTDHFPEGPNPVREGVAPHRDDRTKRDVPPGARWTKISRKLVNPEALTIGKERFEVRDDFVFVLRVLSKEEIEAYTSATSQLRKRRAAEAGKESPDRDLYNRRPRARSRSPQGTGAGRSRGSSDWILEWLLPIGQE